MSFWKIYNNEETIDIVQGDEDEILRYINIKFPCRGYLYKKLTIPLITTESNKQLRCDEKFYQDLRQSIFGVHYC